MGRRVGFGSLVLVAAMAVGSSTAAASPRVFVGASQTEAVDVSSVRRHLARSGVELVAAGSRSQALDVVLLLVESPTRAQVFVRTDSGLDSRVLQRPHASRSTRWIAEGVLGLLNHVETEWSAAPIRDPWGGSTEAWSALDAIRDGIVDPWQLRMLSERVDAPVVLDPWR